MVWNTLATNVKALCGNDACMATWVERNMSRYVRIDNIPEEDWSRQGWAKLRSENAVVAWGHRDPVVVRRQWGNVSVKAEVESASVAYDLVKKKAKWGGVAKFVEVCVLGSGAKVMRAQAGRGGRSGNSAGAEVGRTNTTRDAILGVGRVGTVVTGVGRRCYGCGGLGHFAAQCQGGFRYTRRKCFGCGEEGHVMAFCPGRSLPVVTDNGPVPAAGTTGVKRGTREQGARTVGGPGPLWIRGGRVEGGTAPMGARNL